MKVAVIYHSKYGTTKRYAEWIAEALDASLFERRAIQADGLQDYDLVIYGGGLYAGGISGVKLVTQNSCKNLIVFTVGLASPEGTDYSKILAMNLPAEMLQHTKVFHLRGGIDYRRLGLVHKVMMFMMKTMIKRKAAKNPAGGMSQEDKEFLSTYGKQVDFTDLENIVPLVKYVRYELFESE